MKYYPTLETVRQTASSGGYRRVPICCELLADRYTPVEVMRILRGASRHCYLLESASQTEVWGRYSFLGCNPSLELTVTDHELRIRRLGKDGTERVESRRVEHPGEALREILRENKSPVMEGFPPFTGGLAGYFSYDYIKYSEPGLETSEGGDGDRQQDFRDMDLMLFDEVVAFDHYRQKICLIAGVRTGEPESREAESREAESHKPESHKPENHEPGKLKQAYDEAVQRLERLAALIRGGERKEFPPLKLQSELKPLFSREEYGRMVERAKKYIFEGDIFQVVLSNPVRAKAEGSLFDTYRVLRASNPSPYMFYFSSDDIEIAGASPETLVKLTGQTLSTFPLAGTRPRGRNREEDLRLEQELLQDEKELAEHNMLVDLGRNDLGKISRTGSVKVEKYLSVERFSHVMHLGSTVTGQIREDKDAVDAVDAVLPAGTLSGAPKFRACQIIGELEGSRRGIYGGAIGYLDFAGNLDTCIAIRLVYRKNGEICIRSGAGIVADSEPQKEFEECLNKAKAVVQAIRQAQEGLE